MQRLCLTLIVIVSPVLGLRPVLSPLSRTSKGLPNPLRDTLSPFTRASVTTSTNAVTTLSTSVLSFLYLKQLLLLIQFCSFNFSILYSIGIILPDIMYLLYLLQVIIAVVRLIY